MSLQRAAQLRRQPVSPLVLIVFQDDLQEQIRPRHSFNDTMGFVNCKICDARRPRRYCPGVRGDICAPCCGAEREQTVNCPLDCEYLIEARRRDKGPDVNPKDFPNQDIRVDERFLVKNEELLIASGQALLQASFETPGAVDNDVREALDALIRTYRTMQSGLIYETRPTNPLAASVQVKFQALIDSYRRAIAEKSGVNTIRDADILGILAFLQRLEIQHNNARRLGRAFIHFLQLELAPQAAAAPSLIVP